MRRWLLSALVLAVGGGLTLFGWAVFALGPGLREGPRVVEIPAHLGVVEVGRRLEDVNAVRSGWGFVALAVVRGSARSLKAGEYEFPRDASLLTVLGMLEAGKVRQHQILHPEGATVGELARALEAERLATADELLRVAADPGFVRSLGIEAPTLEGYLFPDTYQFVRGMSAAEILTRMVQRMRAKVTPEIRDRARERGLDLHGLLTLASIIEREAVVRDEMRLISAVFWNRLRRDMPLQADPTVQYAVRKERGTLTRADLQADHPYNTYRRPGLPPGPIASPGIQAIEATLDPAPVEYLYFVAIDDRRHQFSTTIEQHNAAVARYRLLRARDAAAPR